MNKERFDEYVESWFHNYLDLHSNNVKTLQKMFDIITGRQDNEPLSDWIEDGETVADYLKDCNGEQVFEQLMIGNNNFPDFPDAGDFVGDMLADAVKKMSLDKYEFVDEFVKDMADEIVCRYDGDALSFFQDLQNNGCSSGMIGFLIYNSDCLDVYSRYCNNMEDFRDDLEDEFGAPIHRKKGLYYYTWICWFCYEELAHQIAEYLFEDSY